MHCKGTESAFCYFQKLSRYATCKTLECYQLYLLEINLFPTKDFETYMDESEEARADHRIIDQLPLCVSIVGKGSNKKGWLQQELTKGGPIRYF